MKISEVSEKYGVSQDTLRYYERIGLIPKVPRKPNGIRDYDETSCGWVKFIRCMRSAGLQIEALIEYVTLFGQGDETRGARKSILLEQRESLLKHMADMQACLDRLNVKLEHYGDVEASTEKFRR